MFRASLRSVADPVQHHVCLSCQARRFDAPTRLRQFHAQSALWTELANGQLEAHPGETTSHPREAAKSGSGGNLPNENTPENGESPSNTSPGDEKAPAPSAKPANSRNAVRKERKAAAKARAKGAKKDSKTTSTSGEVKRLNLKDAKKSLEKMKKRAGLVSVSKSVEKMVKIDKERHAKDKPRKSIENMIEKDQERDAKDKPRTLRHIAGFTEEKENGSINSTDQAVKALDVSLSPVPRLSFGLDRVLFNPGVYHLRDPRSRVYNFDPYLGQIMPVTEFDFNALKAYITSSRDETLRDIAAKENKKYVGSSSSMTSVLSQFHYLLSAWRPIDLRTVSQGFPDRLRTFTRLLRAPAAMFLHYQDGTYAIDADKEFDTANILMNLGKSMEKLLTLPKEEFERYRRTHENKISAEEEQATPESYHFSTYGDFIMRSQLDAYDPRLPGTGMFDLKTRAVVSIRMDAKNFEHGLGYEIKDRYGSFESYEREFYDMARAAFLKYSLQVRVGRMDGIFVAFHNVERIFGFQYISLPEMDQALHGQTDTALGDAEFGLSLDLWNKILDKATEKFPKQSLRFHFETRDAVTPFMYIFAEPVTQDDISAIQNKNKAEIEAYQQRLLNLHPSEDNDDLNSSAPDSSSSSSEDMESGSSSEEEKPLLAMALTIRNKVNGEYVERPTKFTPEHNWTVEYEISQLSPAQGRVLYKMCQTRRGKALMGRGEDDMDAAGTAYLRQLRAISKLGREHRSRENELDKERGIVVLGDSTE